MSTPDISFNLAANYYYGNVIDLSQLYTSNSSGAVTFAVDSGFGSYVSITDASATMTDISNNVSITLTQSADGSFDSGTATATFNILKATPTILFVGLTGTYGVDASFTLAATSTSDGTFTYSSDASNIVTDEGIIGNAGTANITASLSEGTYYTALSETAEFTVSKGTPTILFVGLTGTYGVDASFTLAASSTSDGTFTYSSNATNIVTNAGIIQGAGTAVITASLSEGTNYTALDASAEFTVSKGTPSLTFADSSANYGANPITFAPVTNSDGTFTYLSDASNIIDISGNKGVIKGAGTAHITAQLGSGTNYNARDVSATFVINKGTPSLSGFSISNKLYSDISFVIPNPTSTFPVGATFTFVSNNPIITIAGNVATIQSGSTTESVTITATQTSTANTNAATRSATFSVSVVPTSNICFYKGALVLTDQGEIAIEKIDSNINTIRGKPIVAITKTKTYEKHVVCIEKDSLGTNIPSQNTYISKNHKILYNKQMTRSIDLVGKVDGVYKKQYKGEILYNVLMETENKMLVNNLIAETLDPENIVAKLYNGTYNSEEVDIIVNDMNYCAEKYKYINGKRR